MSTTSDVDEGVINAVIKDVEENPELYNKLAGEADYTPMAD